MSKKTTLKKYIAWFLIGLGVLGIISFLIQLPYWFLGHPFIIGQVIGIGVFSLIFFIVGFWLIGEKTYAKICSIFIIIIIVLGLGIPFLLHSTIETTEETYRDLTPEEERQIWELNLTLIKFYYVDDYKLETIKAKNILEEILTLPEFENQILVVKIKDVNPRLEIIGFTLYQNNFIPKTILLEINATKDEIVDSLCELVLSPPLECYYWSLQ